ncbi:MAG: regulatory protein RecX [Pseudomonadota bacterium]|nr:regulatory protein RecX [Pseudomonadota bacterium]
MNASDLWNKSLDILSRREHSVSELRNKLIRFNPDPNDLKDVIERLITSNFLDDKRFASAFIRSKAESGYGPNYISQYLAKKGIPSDKYDIYSLEIDWEDKCLTQFNKKRRNKEINFKEKEKILRFLAYRGFSYEIIKNALKEFD